MKTLCMDTAHRHLILVLMEDGEIKASLEKECWKHQSESLFPELIKCMEQARWQSEDIDEVVITDGPGSCTHCHGNGQSFLHDVEQTVVLHFNLTVVCRNRGKYIRDVGC